MAEFCAHLGCQLVSGALLDFTNSCTAQCLCLGRFVSAMCCIGARLSLCFMLWCCIYVGRFQVSLLVPCPRLMFRHPMLFIDTSFIFTGCLDHIGCGGSLFVACVTLNAMAHMGVFFSNWADTVLLASSVIPATAPVVFTFGVSSLLVASIAACYVYTSFGWLGAGVCVCAICIVAP